MTDVLIQRAITHGDLELRSDGRTVYGMVVPFDRETTVNDGAGNYREVFRNGAFTRSINAGVSRVKLFMNHNHRRGESPIGVATMLRQDPAGLVGEFRVPDTRGGAEALELVREGVLDSFSVGFAEIPGKDRRTRGLVERLEVKLREASLVAFPAYEGALISGLRAELGDEELERLVAFARTLDTRLPEPATGTSVSDPSLHLDDSVGHSSGTRTRAQRRAAVYLTGLKL